MGKHLKALKSALSGTKKAHKAKTSKEARVTIQDKTKKKRKKEGSEQHRNEVIDNVDHTGSGCCVNHHRPNEESKKEAGGTGGEGRERVERRRRSAH